MRVGNHSLTRMPSGLTIVHGLRLNWNERYLCSALNDSYVLPQ